MQKQINFINSKQTLKDTLLSLDPPYSTVLQYLPKNIVDQLNPSQKAYFDNSFILKNQEQIESLIRDPPKTFEQLLEQVVKAIIIAMNKKSSKALYAQSVGQKFQNYTVQMTTFNFGKTIVQNSQAFKTLFAKMPYIQLYLLLLNHTIIVPYRGQYIQIAGRLLNEAHNMNAYGIIKKTKQITRDPKKLQYKGSQKESQKDTQKERRKKSSSVESNKSSKSRDNQGRTKPKYFRFSELPINRLQMLYCSHMNKNPGLFAKNIFFDTGLKKAKFIDQTKHLIDNIMRNSFMNKVNFNQQTQDKIFQFLHILIQKFRQILCQRTKGGKVFNKFGNLLKKYCHLPSNYYDLRKQVLEYQAGNIKDPTPIFDQLYSNFTPYQNVSRLLKQIIRKILPDEFMGPNNKQILMSLMFDFVSMKRYQNYKMNDVLYKMDVFDFKWQNDKYNKKFHKQIVTRKRKLLALIIAFVLNQIIVPVIKCNFYVTEKHKQANKLFYFRKPIWTYLSKMAIKKFSDDNLEYINRKDVDKLRRDIALAKPEGKLRILPKKGTFRPIITFNRKVGYITDYKCLLKATLNQILSDTQLVLRNLKDILGQKFGYCIFDNNQIMRKYEAFVQKWRKKGCPTLKYFTLDISKCYDSIDITKLMKFIENSEYIEDQYLIVKYSRFYRNKKPLNQNGFFTKYFNYKERNVAVPMSQDPIQIRQAIKVPAIHVFPAQQKLITKDKILEKLKKICQGIIISYRNDFWLQKLGIPQGLNVSGILCSLYFAYLQKRYVQVHQGLLMRLTDDYLYIGPETQAVSVLDSLLRCAQQNNFAFSEQKISKNFQHKTLTKMTNNKQITWIGKKINIETLQMMPNFQMSSKIAYAMNVNLNKKMLKKFLKNKLKSLLTNHFNSYFQPKLFPFSHQVAAIRVYTEMSLEKFYPFIVKIIQQKIPNKQRMMIGILKSCFHEFVLYCCKLAQKDNQILYYNQLYIQILDEFIKFCGRKSVYLLKVLKGIFSIEMQKLKSMIV